MTATSERLEQFMARAEIHDVLYRYCHACDRRDWAMMKSVYHPGAMDNHNTFDGPADQFVDYLAVRFEQAFGLTQHHITTINIEFDGKGDLTHGLMTISQVKNGKWEVISK